MTLGLSQGSTGHGRPGEGLSPGSQDLGGGYPDAEGCATSTRGQMASVPCPQPSWHSDSWVYPTQNLTSPRIPRPRGSCSPGISALEPSRPFLGRLTPTHPREPRGRDLLLDLCLATCLPGDLHQLLAIALLGLGPAGTKRRLRVPLASGLSDPCTSVLETEGPPSRLLRALQAPP